MTGPSQPSPRGAIVMGVLFVLGGVPPMLVGLGVITPSSMEPSTPPWVPFCAGLLFALAGLALILDYGIAGGVGPDGDFRPGTPFAVRVANFALGLTIVGMMTAVVGWIAFGSGPRRFSTTISLPFMTQRWMSGERSGRVAFGVAAVLLAAMFVGCGVVGIERLRRAGRG